MKKNLIFFFLTQFLLLVAADAKADGCLPCKGIVSMQEMVQNSDVVVIARRGDKAIGDKYEQGPESVELEILEVLKGDGSIAVEDIIDVQSWYGICPYGVQMERFEKAVVFLNKVSSGVWFFSNAEYESGTYSRSLCNDEAMTLQGSGMIIWDPAIRQEVKYPLDEFKRVFTNKYLTPEQRAAQQSLIPQQAVIPEQTPIPK